MADKDYSDNRTHNYPNSNKSKYIKIPAEELKLILKRHRKWLDTDGKEGTQAELIGCDLSTHLTLLVATQKQGETLNLSRAILNKSRLENAHLPNINFEKAQLIDVDLSKSNLRNANLAGAILYNADLSEADLLDANLQDTDLRNTNFKGAKSLLAQKLAGMDLTGAKMPDDINNFEEPLRVVEEASKNSRNLFFIMLLACAYVLLSVATTTDAELILNAKSFMLPIIGSPIPTEYFYWYSPFFLLALYVYFHFYLLRMFENMADLPAIFPDGRPLHKKSYPWLLSGLVCEYFDKLAATPPALIKAQVLLSYLLGWLFVPLTIYVVWSRYLYKHSMLHASIFGTIIIISIIIGIISHWHVANAFIDKRFDFMKMASIIFMGAFLFSMASTLVLQRPFNAYLVETDLSIKPSNWTGNNDAELDLVIGAKLMDAHLEGAYALSAFLAKADLRGAHLEGANLMDAHLERANLMGAHLEGANLSHAHLEKAFLGSANFEGANLKKANLKGAILIDANLKGASLTNSKIEAAWLDHANLESVNLEYADLQGTFMEYANLKGACLNNATFGRCTTPDTEMITYIKFANLSGVTGLTQEQLERGFGNHSTILPTGYIYPANWQ